MALGVFRAGVGHASWIEMAPRAFAIGHRAVAEFVHMEAMLTGLQAGELADNFNAIFCLCERNFALHFVFAKSFDHGNGVRDLAAHAAALGRRAAFLGAPRLAFL